jgi:hypothetical protein
MITRYMHLVKSFFSLALVILMILSATLVNAGNGPFAGGFIETYPNIETRVPLTAEQIASFLPSRGEFTFPAPYKTSGIRITNDSDCMGSDCVNYVGYSYWRRINNHAGHDTLYILMVLNPDRGGTGPALFSYNKITGVVQNLGALFDQGDSFYWHHGEGWYFSATRPHSIYMSNSTILYRFDIISKQLEVVFDIRSPAAIKVVGNNRMIWQEHSSDDDRVHSATVRMAQNPWSDLGCIAYREDTAEFSYYPTIAGDFDECQIDKSGRWLLIKENVDGQYGEDNRIIDLQTGSEKILLDQNGAAGHSDNGYGYMVAADNWTVPGATRLWKFDEEPLTDLLVYRHDDWYSAAPNHVSHLNARPGFPAQNQYACGSTASRHLAPHANEIICFRLDASLDTLVAAPVMTNLDAPGGGDDYSKMPKGNLDITGQYFIWTSNMSGNRLDAFIVKVPYHQLTGAALSSGDYDVDLDIDGPDLSTFAAYYATLNILADVNGDKVVNALDVESFALIYSAMY